MVQFVNRVRDFFLASVLILHRDGLGHHRGKKYGDASFEATETIFQASVYVLV